MSRLDEEKRIALEGGLCLFPHCATFKEVDGGRKYLARSEAVLFEQGADPVIALRVPGKVVPPAVQVSFGSIGENDSIGEGRTKKIGRLHQFLDAVHRGVRLQSAAEKQNLPAGISQHPIRGMGAARSFV